MLDQTEVFVGVPHLLATLQSAGIKIGIVSTKFRSRIESILRRNHLGRYVDLVIGSEDVTFHKPHPEGIRRA